MTQPSVELLDGDAIPHGDVGALTSLAPNAGEASTSLAPNAGEATIDSADPGMESNKKVEVPSLNKTFKTEQDAYDFYNEYAKDKGFSVRRHKSNKNKAGLICHMEFVCSKQGTTDDTYQEKIKNSQPRTGERNRGETRCMCLASMSIRRIVNGDGFIISKFVEEHTHAVATPTKVQYLNSHRNMPKSKKKLVDEFSQANVPLFQQYRILESRAGGASSVGFCEKDLRNYRRDLRQELLGHDAESLIYFLEKEKSRNANCYYVYDVETVETEGGDEQKIFKRCFWADCESRNAFAYFGDVVVFDTTYNTNAYSMILGTFVGVNNHRQTVVFGSALLSDETTDSFRWLFSEFLAAMPYREPPKIIITDQDQAIGRAVSDCFPNTVHRLCLWHIENKFSEKIGPALYTEYKSSLFNLITDSETAEDFEKGWGALMSTTQLGANEWLRKMYEIRARWVPAYVRHIFAAGISSSQRVEANHAFFKRFVISQNSLMDFILRYWMAIDHQRNAEMRASYIDWAEVPRSVTSFPMEKQMAAIYTKTIFLRFQEELQKSLMYLPKKILALDDRKVYESRRVGGDCLSNRVRTLTCFSGSDVVTCSCKLFEFQGYPCRHVLRLLLKNDVMYLPDQYILERWTKKAKEKPVFDEFRLIGPEQTFVSRCNTLAGFAMEMVHEAAITPDISNFALTEMTALRRKIKDRIDAGATPVSLPMTRSSVEPLNVADPIAVRTKGSSKRMRSSREKAIEKKKKSCSNCKSPGHTIRKCPQLQSRSQLVDQEYDDDIYRPVMSQMEYDVEGNIEDNLGTSMGLGEHNEAMLGDEFLGPNSV